MKRFLLLIMLMNIILCCTDKATDPPEDEFIVVNYSPADASKSNNTKVYMHYMPWFESKEINGDWGIHWTMSTQNPDIVDNDGRRQIASHFYPLIGPYSSMDKDVIEYHLLLMKLSGIDGLLIDWYGSYNVNDYMQNSVNTEAVIDMLDETGLTFGIVYEEYTAEKVANQNQASSPIEAAKADLKYMHDNYFSNQQYIQIDNTPLLLTFGPRYFQTENEWTQIFSGITPKPVFLTLWNQSGDAGSNADGEFAWVYRFNMFDLNSFYDYRVPKFQTSIGSAYHGFYAFYEEGGWGDQIGWTISYNENGTLSSTLERAAEAGIPLIQLVTWNDFGEGTMLEPTVEFGYTFLETIQQFTGVTYNKSELEMVFRLYHYRKEYKDDEKRQLKLDQVFYYLVSLQVSKAGELLDIIE